MNDGLHVPGRARQARNAAEDQLLHRLRRLAVQTPRARTDAAVFQAGAQDRRRRPVGHSATRLRHAEVPRGQAVPRSPAASTCRSSATSICLTKGVAKLFNSGKLAGCVVSDELLATIEKYAAGPDKGQKFFQELAAKQLAVFKGLGFAAGYLGGIAKADELRPDHRPGRELRPERLAGVHQGDPVLPARRVLPLRARSADRPERSDADQPRVSRVAAASAEVEGSDAELPALAAGPRAGLHARQGAVSAADSGSSPGWDKKPGFLSRMAYRLETGVEAGDVRLPGLRRLQPARLRLPVPEEHLLEVRRATAPAAARPTAAANWTTRNVSGPGSTSG